MKKRKKQIKAVIFDVGGVLEIENKPLKTIGKINHFGVHEYIAKKLKISLDQYFDSIDTNYALSIEGKISEKKTISFLSKNLKTTSKKLIKLYKKAYKKNFKQNKQLFKQAFKLKQLGYKITILSDQWYLSYRALMSDKKYKKFSPVIVSCFVGMRKPNPKIYKLTLKKLKLKPSECIFIDNQEWNIKPAKKLGIKTILFKNNKQLFKDKIWRDLFYDK